MKLTDDRAEKAMRYLASTDEEAANLRALAEIAEAKAKAVRDSVFMLSEGTVAERQAIAGSCEQYREAMAEYFDALRAYDAVRNKRTTEAILIECWRSVQANRRAGNV